MSEREEKEEGKMKKNMPKNKTFPSTRSLSGYAPLRKQNNE
jgi:hypothetical protein